MNFTVTEYELTKASMKTIEEREEFYNRCAEILAIRHEFVVPVRRRNRWNTRRLGNGRFEGFGLIRCHGACVVVTTKSGTRVYKTYQDVYDVLESINGAGDGLSGNVS